MVLPFSLPFSINIGPANSQISIFSYLQREKNYSRKPPFWEGISLWHWTSFRLSSPNHPFAAERLGKFTASKLWLNCSPNVRRSKEEGNFTVSRGPRRVTGKVGQKKRSKTNENGDIMGISWEYSVFHHVLIMFDISIHYHVGKV